MDFADYPDRAAIADAAVAIDEQAAVVDLYAGHGLRLDEAVPLALAAESAGFGGLWTLEAHTEPFLPLVLAAEHTSRIELGTAVAVARPATRWSSPTCPRAHRHRRADSTRRPPGAPPKLARARFSPA